MFQFCSSVLYSPAPGWGVHEELPGLHRQALQGRKSNWTLKKFVLLLKINVCLQVEQDLAMGTDAEGEFCQISYFPHITSKSHFCGFFYGWSFEFATLQFPYIVFKPGEKIRDHMRNIVPILLDQNVTINDKIRFDNSKEKEKAQDNHPGSSCCTSNRRTGSARRTWPSWSSTLRFRQRRLASSGSYFQFQVHLSIISSSGTWRTWASMWLWM